MISDATTKQRISANVQRLLQARAWTQMRLAAATGETQATISRIVNALHMPNAATLARIAEAFDVTVDRLLMEPPEEILVPGKKSA